MSTVVPPNVEPTTGEIFGKAYQRPEHSLIGNTVVKQLQYINDNLRDENDLDKFARQSADTLSNILMELTAMYASLSKWLADEKLHVADTKTAWEMKFAEQYIILKKTHTNETARMQAKLLCKQDEKDYNKIKNSYDRVESWKKVIGRYHDAVRSQLSYEKQMGNMGRGQ